MKDTLHIYGQEFQHAQVEIAGDPDSLRRLAETILDAVERGKSSSSPFYVTDGEGYSVDVYAFTPEQMSQLRLPYTDENARDFEGTTQLWPFEVVT